MTAKKPIINFILLEKRWEKSIPSWQVEIPYALEKTAEALGKDFSEIEVSVVFANDKEVQTLNKTFRHKDKPTNVLSFPSDEKEELGDIILAFETIIREANDAEIS